MLDVVTLLLEKGADAHAKDSLGSTPLHEAVRSSQKEVAYFLLEHGAVAVIGNNLGETPLDALKPEGRAGRRPRLPSGALVQIATDAVDAHEKRLERIVKGLMRAVESVHFLSDLASALAGIGASGTPARCSGRS